MAAPGAWGVPLAVGAVLALFVLLAFLLFAVCVMLHRSLSDLLQTRLAANCLLGHMPTAFLLHPASIHMYLLGRPISAGYCWVYLHLQCFTEMFTPYALLMFSIERLMYIRKPTAHAQKLSRPGAIALLAFPWAMSILVAILDISVTTSRVLTQRPLGDANASLAQCCRDKRAHHIAVDIVLRILSGGLIPIVTCVVIVTVLVMWCCFKRRMSLGMDYDMMGQEEVATTVRGSIIAVAVPNFLLILVLVAEVATQIRLRYRLFAVISLFGIIEGVVWLYALPELRTRLAGMVPTCCARQTLPVPTESGPAAISYGPADDNEDSVLYSDAQTLPI